MDLRQLKTLLAVAECGTFGKAAEAVHLTPSAVSQQMNALETEVGVPLFDRASRRSTTLNTHGLQMVEAAQKLLQTAEEAIDAISGRRPVGALNVGSVRTSAFPCCRGRSSRCRLDIQTLRIKLRVGSDNHSLRTLLRGAWTWRS